MDDLSFTVEPGRVTGFLGPNGAGKTTTLRMLLNLVTPDRRHGDHRRPALRRPRTTRCGTVGAVLEASSAHKGRTGRQPPAGDLRRRRAARQRADEVLELVGLTPAAKRKFKGYSLGMRQRLGIAAAMLGDPRVLILDEPANGLDPEGIRWMRDLLKALAAQGRTVLVSSHLLSEMELLADDVVIIAAGQLIRAGPGRRGPRRRWPHGRRSGCARPQPDAADRRARRATAPRSPRRPDGALLVTGVDAAAVGHAALAAGVELHELAARAPRPRAGVPRAHGRERRASDERLDHAAELLKIRTTNDVVDLRRSILLPLWALALLDQLGHCQTSVARRDPASPDVAGGRPGVELIRACAQRAPVQRRRATSTPPVSSSALLLVMLLGAIMVTNEFFHQTATTTFLTTPHRDAR